MTEAQMLTGLKAGHKNAQEFLFQKYSAKLLGVCYRYGHNRQDAEDMLQEGFIKIYSQIHQFRGEGSLEGWMRRIIVHTCINIIKKNKKFNDCVELMLASHIQVREEWIPSIVNTKQIIETIRALPLGYKTVLNLFAIEGYSHREIADLLEIEESTSRSQYNRAKNLLFELLLDKGLIDERYKPGKTKSTLPSAL